MEYLDNNEKIAQELKYYYFRKQEDKITEGRPRKELIRNAIANIIKTRYDFEKQESKWDDKIKELEKMGPKAIITTNYDQLLENIFNKQYKSLFRIFLKLIE